jgi:predicted transcriptional regulator
MQEKGNLVELTADIVAAYVGNNTVAQADLPKLIANIYRSLATATHGAAEPKPVETVELKPAVPIRNRSRPTTSSVLRMGRSSSR